MKLTTELELKFGPVTVSVKLAAPLAALAGEMLDVVGTGLLTVKGALSPAVTAVPPLVRVAVMTTPFSPTLYVTPVTVPVFAPTAIVPVTVPPSVPVPVFFESEKLRVGPVTFAGLPLASCCWTTTGKPMPAAGLETPSTEVITSFDAAPAPTVNGALSAEASASPLVRLAVSTTPLSAYVYVTTLIVMEPEFAAIVPVSVPPSVPVPVLRVMLRFVSAETGTALPTESCDCTTIENEFPAVGLAGLIEVIASFDTAPATTVNGALEPADTVVPPLVLVAVITTPLSAFEYVTLVTVTVF